MSLQNISYAIAMTVFAVSVYGVIFKDNLIKKVISLSLATKSVNIFLILIGYKANGVAPIYLGNIDFFKYSVDPLPQALVLTSIVIDFSITALLLYLVMLYYKKSKSLSASEVKC